MCKLCVKAKNLVAKNTDKEFAEFWLYNYTGFPFWSGANTLKEAELFVKLSPEKQKVHLSQFDKDLEDAIPLYRRYEN